MFGIMILTFLAVIFAMITFFFSTFFYILTEGFYQALKYIEIKI